MIKALKKLLFYWSYKRAVRKANNLKKITKYAYLVIKYKGRLKVIARKDLKKMVELNVFGKHRTIRDIEKIAIYRTI